MPPIVGVRLRNAAKPVLFDTDTDSELKADDIVVVSTERGRELGRIADEPREAQDGDSMDARNRIERVATADDLATAEELHRKERAAMPVYRRLVAKHKLDMKPTDVEFAFEGDRAVFYFVAEERVDFRDLVRDLATEFHVRVDMRQIGVRDEARMIGGLGHCGEQLCCVRFGGEFQPVSIRMAKEQDLPLNPLKISGLCGRLMCCLRYEYEAYKDFKGRAPKKGAIVEVGEGKGKVVDFNTPRETVTMRLEEGGSLTVALSDMECGGGQGCPCKVKAEALERRNEAMSEAIGSVATMSGGTPSLSSGTSAPTVAPSEGAGEGERGGRRRRRRSGGSGGEASGSAAPAAQAPSQPRQRQRSGGGGAGAGKGGQQPKAKGAPQAGGQPPQQPKPAASGEAGALPGRRRRRRRSGGGSAPGAPAE